MPVNRYMFYAFPTIFMSNVSMIIHSVTVALTNGYLGIACGSCVVGILGM